MNALKNKSTDEEWPKQLWTQPEHTPAHVSTVIDVTHIKDNEQIFTVTIPLKNGETITKEWTLWEIIQLRKQLEAEWKLTPLYEFDDATQNQLLEFQDITRWNFWSRWNMQVVDEKKLRLDKELALQKKKERIYKIMQEIESGKNTLISYTDKSKKAVIEILLIGEERIKKVLTKDTLVKTWNIINDVVEKWIYYTIPWTEWSIPHIKKRIIMTWKQLLDILQWTMTQFSKKKQPDQDNQ